MVIRQLLVIFFLATTPGASVFSLFDLKSNLVQLSIENNHPLKTKEEQPIGTKVLEFPLSLEEIIEQGDALHASTLNGDIKSVVKEIENKLTSMLASGATLLDLAPIINSFFFDAEELVLIAQGIQAYTLLKLLQAIYIWHDEAQFHWFQALSYKSPWYDEILWETYTMNWMSNLQAVFACDNGDLAAIIQDKLLSQNILESFNQELLVLCAEYDALKIFKATKMEPICLEKHLKLMAINGSVRLLQLYQSFGAHKHLHLEKYPLSTKLPANVEDFAFLMDHGYEYLPVDQFIERFCKEGRLNLLEYLHKLETKLIPEARDLELAAENGWMNILKWAFQKGFLNNASKRGITVCLALNHHFQALDEWMNMNSLVVEEWVITTVIDAGDLEALAWIDERQPIRQGRQKWSNSAAEGGHLPVLKWLYRRFKYLPGVGFLKNASVEMLEWIKATDKTLIGATLVEYGAGNLELLQWVQNNAPIFILQENADILSRRVCNRKMMIWLYGTLEICPYDMNWAYAAGDLEAIQWALKNCKIFPISRNVSFAAGKGHLYIIKWVYKNYLAQLCIVNLLRTAIATGNLNVADYLMSKFTLKEKVNVQINIRICADRRLDILKWVYKHKHNFNMAFLNEEMGQAASRGELQTLTWIAETFTNISSGSLLWKMSSENCHFEIYAWLLKRYPKQYQQDELKEDICKAFTNGHLEMVKVILAENYSLKETISNLSVTKKNHHIKRWLIANY